MDTAPVHLEGYLQQRSAVKSLKKKWFVLRDQELKVYNNPNDAISRATCQDMIYIHDVQGVRKLASGSSSKCAIEIVSRFRKYTLVAPNSIEQDKWIKAFHDAMRNVRMRSQSSPIPGYHDREGQYNPNPSTPPEVRKQRMSAVEGLNKDSSSQKKRLFSESWIGKKLSRKSASVDDELLDRQRHSSNQSDQSMSSNDDGHIYDVVSEFKTIEENEDSMIQTNSSDEDVFAVEKDMKQTTSDIEQTAEGEYDSVARATSETDLVEKDIKQTTSEGEYDPVARATTSETVVEEAKQTTSEGEYDSVPRATSETVVQEAKQTTSEGEYDSVARATSETVVEEAKQMTSEGEYDSVARATSETVVEEEQMTSKADGYDPVAKATKDTFLEDEQMTSKADGYDLVNQITSAENEEGDKNVHQMTSETDDYDPVTLVPLATDDNEVKDSKQVTSKTDDYDSLAHVVPKSDDYDLVAPVDNVVQVVLTNKEPPKIETVIPDESTAQAFEDPIYIEEELRVDNGVEELRKMIRDSGLDFDDTEDDYEMIEGAGDDTPAMAKLKEMLGTM